MHSNHPSRRGASKLEVSVAIVLIGVLVALVTPSRGGSLHDEAHRVVIEDLRTIEAALLAYFTDVGTLAPLHDVRRFGPTVSNPARLHLVTGDGEEGWDGPYLEDLPNRRPFGGEYDVDVFSPNEASIDLGTRSKLGNHFPRVLEAVDEALDGDGDPKRGRVWGDSNGIHLGFNFVKE